MSKKSKSNSQKTSKKTDNETDVRKKIAGFLLALNVKQGTIAEYVGISQEHLSRNWKDDPAVKEVQTEWKEKFSAEIEPLVPLLIQELFKIAMAEVERDLSASEKMSAIDKLFEMADKKPPKKVDLTSGGEPIGQLSELPTDELVKVAEAFGIANALGVKIEDNAGRNRNDGSDTGNKAEADPGDSDSKGSKEKEVAE